MCGPVYVSSSEMQNLTLKQNGSILVASIDEYELCLGVCRLSDKGAGGRVTTMETNGQGRDDNF